MYQAYGVLGRFLGHSLSPKLHNNAFQLAGMNRAYFKWEIMPEDLEVFMRAVRILPLSGISVTIPYKEDVMSWLDYISPDARGIGAVNTVYWENNSLCGTNTDYLGFLAPIRDMYFDSALVLGAGGACRAVLFGLKHLNVNKILLCNRHMDKALSMAGEFHVQAMPWEDRHRISADLLVNTTPLGTAGHWENHTPWENDLFPFQAVYDLVYNPLQTRLLRQARIKGVQTVSGLSMFVHQGLEQFRIWTGQDFDPAWAEQVLTRYLSSSASNEN